MADSFVSKLITELTAKTTAADTDLVPIADSNGNFFKMTWQKMKQILLGTKDISNVGDGTVTGAISELNTKITNTEEKVLTVQASKGEASYIIKNGICFVRIEVTAYEIKHDTPICWTLPASKISSLLYFSLGTAGGHNYTAYLRKRDNALCFYYPSYTTVERIDATICYPVL